MATSLSLPEEEVISRRRSSQSRRRVSMVSGRPDRALSLLDRSQLAQSFPSGGRSTCADRLVQCSNLDCMLTIIELRHELRLARLQCKKLLKSQADETLMVARTGFVPAITGVNCKIDQPLHEDVDCKELEKKSVSSVSPYDSCAILSDLAVMQDAVADAAETLPPCCASSLSQPARSSSQAGRHTFSVTCCDKPNCTEPSFTHHHRRRVRPHSSTQDRLNGPTFRSHNYTSRQVSPNDNRFSHRPRSATSYNRTDWSGLSHLHDSEPPETIPLDPLARRRRPDVSLDPSNQSNYEYYLNHY